MALLITYDLQTLVLALSLIAIIVRLARFLSILISANTKSPREKFADYYLTRPC